MVAGPCEPENRDRDGCLAASEEKRFCATFEVCNAALDRLGGGVADSRVRETVARAEQFGGLIEVALHEARGQEDGSGARSRIRERTRARVQPPGREPEGLALCAGQ